VASFVTQPFGDVRLGNFLIESLNGDRWTSFRAAVAFVKYSGVKHVARPLSRFAQRASVRLAAGIDAGGTSYEGLSGLLDALAGRGDLYIFHNPGRTTFHPKVYVFRNETIAEIAVGSGNLTEGGLFTNYEASLLMRLDLSVEEDRKLLASIDRTLDAWSTQQEGLCYRLDADLLRRLTAEGLVPNEAQARDAEERAATRLTAEEGEERYSIFRRSAIPAAPAYERDGEVPPDEEEAQAAEAAPAIPSVPAQPGRYNVFVMTLQRTDVGVGQTTAGTSRRSPEIFIPLAARDADPDFWGWPGSFTEDPANAGKMDRAGVRMALGPRVIDVNMMTWPVKHDFRLRSETLRSSGEIGDVLRLERADGRGGYSYVAEVIPAGTPRHAQHLALCTNAVRNSARRWGYA
jgi:HKD family nuclease